MQWFHQASCSLQYEAPSLRYMKHRQPWKWRALRICCTASSRAVVGSDGAMVLLTGGSLTACYRRCLKGGWRMCVRLRQSSDTPGMRKRPPAMQCER